MAVARMFWETKICISRAKVSSVVINLHAIRFQLDVNFLRQTWWNSVNLQEEVIATGNTAYVKK